MDDHSGLRQGEGERDTDSIERNERGNPAVEGDEDEGGGDGQQDDAVAVGQTVAQSHEGAWCVVVARRSEGTTSLFNGAWLPSVMADGMRTMAH
jgi:hypothetical protein